MTMQAERPSPPPAPPAADIAEKILRQAREAAYTTGQFFAEHAQRIVQCCEAMAKAFDAGGKLLTFGNGGSCCDAMHMAVECTHPIIERRPALPAIALTT